MQLCPDSELKAGTTGRAFRLGLLARDQAGDIWGLTARHVFGDMTCEIRTTDGATLTVYQPEENEPWSNDEDISKQIVRFRVPRLLLTPEKVRYAVVWPRETMDEHRLLGTPVVSLLAQDRIIGTIIETGGLVRVRFKPDQEATALKGAAILSLLDQRLLVPGMAGSLVISESGEAIGLAIARQRSDADTEIVVAPLAPFLDRNRLVPWAPPGAHWSDLHQRVTMFERAARRSISAAFESMQRPPRSNR